MCWDACSRPPGSAPFSAVTACEWVRQIECWKLKFSQVTTMVGGPAGAGESAGSYSRAPASSSARRICAIIGVLTAWRAGEAA